MMTLVQDSALIATIGDCMLGIFLGPLQSRSIGRNIDRVPVARGKLPTPTKSMAVALRATWWQMVTPWEFRNRCHKKNIKNLFYWSIDIHRLVPVHFVLVCKDIFLSEWTWTAGRQEELRPRYRCFQSFCLLYPLDCASLGHVKKATNTDGGRFAWKGWRCFLTSHDLARLWWLPIGIWQHRQCSCSSILAGKRLWVGQQKGLSYVPVKW